MNSAPHLRTSACWMLLVLLLSTAAVSQAQTWPQPFTTFPTAASSTGGSIVRAVGIPTIYFTLTATVDGVSTQIFNGDSRYWVVMPPHPAGSASIVVTVMEGATPRQYIGTATYVDLPQSGLPTPVAVVSRDSLGAPSVRPSEALGGDPSSTSADGRYVVWSSKSRFTEFPPAPTNRSLYVKDRESGTLLRIFACGYECRPSMSADGTRVVAWYQPNSGSQAIALFEYPFSGDPIRVDVDSAGNVPASGNAATATISGNGRFVAFTTSSNLDGASGDTANTNDLFVRDLQTGVTERWTTSANLFIQPPSVSADGRLVALSTTVALLADDTNGVSDVYLLDRQDGVIRRPLAVPVSVGVLSGDGTMLAFSTTASGLVPDDTNGVSDVFVMDLATSLVNRVSLSTGGGQLSQAAGVASISGNGRRIVFTSNAPELTSSPLPAGSGGIFVHDRATEHTSLVNSDATGLVSAPALIGASGSVITPDGRSVIFTALAQNLVNDDVNGGLDLFLKELLADTPAGPNIEAVPVDPTTGETPVALTFAAITTPGDTSVTYTEAAPPLPSGFQVGSRYVDITTTAVFSGAISVCVDYDPATTPDPAALQLLHYEGGAWVNITTGFDPVAHLVCGSTTSLSPFVLAVPPQVTYTAQSLLDPDRVFKAGSTIPIRLQILEGGANVSAADLPLVATGVRLVSTQTDWATPEDPGQSNPDRTFQFTDVEGAPGYRFNLQTTGLTAGTYELQFRVGADGPPLTVTFQIR